MISAVFVDRPRLAIVIAILMTLAGVAVAAAHPGRAVSRHRAAAGDGLHQLRRRLGRRGGGDGRAAARGAGRRRRQDDLHEVQQRQRRQLLADRQLRAGHQPRHRHGQRQQPRAAGAVQAAARGAALRPDRAQAIRRDPGVPAVLQRGRQAGPAVHQQLRHHQRAGPAGAHAGRRRCAAVRPARLLDAHLVRHEPADQPESGAVRHHRCDPRAERAGAGRPHRRAADQRCDAVPAQRADAGTPDHRRSSSATS